MRQITVMAGPERRRRWTDEERLQILAEAAEPGACVADMARRHDISTARIYTWRHKLRQHIAMPQFAEAVVDGGGDEVPDVTPQPAVVIELGDKVRLSIFPSATIVLVMRDIGRSRSTLRLTRERPMRAWPGAMLATLSTGKQRRCHRVSIVGTGSRC